MGFLQFHGMGHCAVVLTYPIWIRGILQQRNGLEVFYNIFIPPSAFLSMSRSEGIVICALMAPE